MFTIGSTLMINIGVMDMVISVFIVIPCSLQTHCTGGALYHFGTHHVPARAFMSLTSGNAYTLLCRAWRETSPLLMRSQQRPLQTAGTADRRAPSTTRENRTQKSKTRLQGKSSATWNRIC